MKPRLIATFIFNLIDTVITLIVTQRGLVEINPVTRVLLYCPPAFAVVKFTLVTLALLYLWKNRTERLARVASWCSLGIYAYVMAHYLFLTFIFYLEPHYTIHIYFW